ncbi:MAG: PDZ domain-containing protein, partial [Planctomycetota bacterium]|nr:PDZ domain-containing protein [Planctomycetota bacterium]
MVGRMKDDDLIVYGTGTAKEFDPLVDQVNKEHGFKIKRVPGGFGPSDHASFYAVKIPVFHIFTGLHNDYHRPGDDTHKLNIHGMERVTNFVGQLAQEVISAEKRPEYQRADRESMRAPGELPLGDRPYFGSIPNLVNTEEGYAIQGVAKDGPAEKAGLQAGDIIVRLGDNKIGNLADFDSALRKFQAGDEAAIEVLRDAKPVKLKVILEPPR